MDLIVASSALSAIAAKQATKVIPIVFLNVSDPVGQGIVASLAYSGTNITGVVEDESVQLTAKRMQLLKDAIPQTAKLAVLMNPDSATDQVQWQQLELAASSLKVMLRPVVARRASEFESTFAAIGRDRPDALFVIDQRAEHYKSQAHCGTGSRKPLASYVRIQRSHRGWRPDVLWI